MSTPATVVERTAGRVLVLDLSNRILLLHGRDPADPAAGTWWFTPGGGVLDGESVEQAAARELFEETGLRVERLGPAVWRRTAEFSFMGERYRQNETFFLAVMADDLALDFSGHTAVEREAVSGARWWTAHELAGSADTIYPTRLADELALLLAERSSGAADVRSTPKDIGT